ncbi:hypothetical protein LTR62_007760 [Meristemomyces frigidus]|uniref:DUF7924 domain-containing protein n=1 Tax=Meristemomyces frigidus TaxID=1508187 RepID=A0AAN7YHM6_9PEZI|nr:hypothetical protein LTR62_007760 [Meristemomyces frigidus]
MLPVQANVEKNNLSAPASPQRKGKQSQGTTGLQDDPSVNDRCKRARSAIEETSEHPVSSAASIDGKNPIEHWIGHKRWPAEFFQQDSNMSFLLARKRSSTPFSEKQPGVSSLTPSSITPSDEKPREVRSAPYARSNYATVLATKHVFMHESEQGVTDACKNLCNILLETPQTVPLESLFRDDVFETTCFKMRDRNEAMVVRDITPLIVPSAQTLATYGARHLQKLTESVNEGWNSAIPFYGPRPQPNYSVGFGRSAFTDDQLETLKPFVGDIADSCTSYFMGTWRMYFPFLACEVKCSASALEVADRQNAHSATIAVRAVVELFRYVKRDKELDRDILTFSISHDNDMVKIYGHYAVIHGVKTLYYRHLIHSFSFVALDGKEKWTAYRFTKNIYDIWMPKHLQRICSAIDQVSLVVNSNTPQRSEVQLSEASGLSQNLEPHGQAQSSAGSQSAQAQVNSRSEATDHQYVTPNTSIEDGGASKRPRTNRSRSKRP